MAPARFALIVSRPEFTYTDLESTMTANMIHVDSLITEKDGAILEGVKAENLVTICQSEEASTLFTQIAVIDELDRAVAIVSKALTGLHHAAFGACADEVKDLCGVCHHIRPRL